MSRAFDDSCYLARTLAASLLDLELTGQESVLAYLRAELNRLGVAGGSVTAAYPQEQTNTHESGPRNLSAAASGPDLNVFIITDEIAALDPRRRTA
jgi:hypothetical protein